MRHKIKQTAAIAVGLVLCAAFLQGTPSLGQDRAGRAVEQAPPSESSQTTPTDAAQPPSRAGKPGLPETLWEKLFNCALEFLSATEAHKADPRPKNQAELLSGNSPKLLSDDQMRTLNGNRILIFSGNRLEFNLTISNSGNHIGTDNGNNNGNNNGNGNDIGTDNGNNNGNGNGRGNPEPGQGDAQSR